MTVIIDMGSYSEIVEFLESDEFRTLAPELVYVNWATNTLYMDFGGAYGKELDELVDKIEKRQETSKVCPKCKKPTLKSVKMKVGAFEVDGIECSNCGLKDSIKTKSSTMRSIMSDDYLAYAKDMQTEEGQE